MFHRVDRSEFKFLIPLRMRDEVIAEVEEHTGYDEEAGGSSQYPIISQYYDNALRDCYWEKQRGQKSRRKLRIRVYGSNEGKMPPTTFIEVKHKHYGRGVKRRLRLPMEDAINPSDVSDNPTTVLVHGSLTSVSGKLGTNGLEFNGQNANRIEVSNAEKIDGLIVISL